MKTKFRFLRIISCLLALSFLSQSCTIYRSTSIGIAEAVESKNKVKVKTTTNRNFNFKRLEKDDAGVYGIAYKRSRSARQLSNAILQDKLADNLVKIKLNENYITEINPRNKTLSILVPLGILAAGISIVALSYKVNASPFGDSGTF